MESICHIEVGSQRSIGWFVVSAVLILRGLTSSARVPCGGAWMWDSKQECEARECVWEPSDKTLNWCIYNATWEYRIETVHLVQGCHFDAGFADTVDHIVQRWFGFFDDAYYTGLELEKNHTDPSAQLRFTAQSWVIWLYLHCPSDLNLTCPDSAALRRFNTSVSKGWITWQAFPFDAELELLSTTTIRLAIELTHAVDAYFGVTRKTVLSQRDVPGISRAALSPLANSGIRAVSVGTNGGSTPPNVPRVFIWKDDMSNASMLTMYLTGGYGGIRNIPGVFVPTVVPGSTHAMVVAWRGDNSGPPSASEVEENIAAIRKEFQQANVIVSTFEDFVDVINVPDVLDRLPTLSSEIGDTWIHGVASDANKLSQFSAIQRAVDKWCASHKLEHHTHLAKVVGTVSSKNSHCFFSNKNITTFVHRFLKNSEHTWGLDVKSTLQPKSTLRSNYSNSEFHRARQENPEYAKLESSWARQAYWGIRNALENLHDENLRNIIESELALTAFSCLNVSGYSINVSAVIVTLQTQSWKVLLNSTSASVLDIQYAGYSLLGKGTTLGQLEYQTFSAQNYTQFMLSYNFIGPLFPLDDYDDFDKVGIDKVPAKYRQVPSCGNGTAYLRDTFSAVIPSKLLDTAAVSEAGGFDIAWSNFTFISANTSYMHMRADVLILNKTITRLPEALFIRFRIPGLCQPKDWTLSKLDAPVSPLDVVDGGAKHNHVVNSFSCALPNGADITIVPLSAPLVSVGSPTPFPTPLRGKVDAGEQGVSILTMNNIWNTNYRMWQGGDFKITYDIFTSLPQPSL
eukprot:gene9254-1533_t